MISREPSLLERLQGIIERTYAMRTGILDVGRFVLGDAGYRRLYGTDTILEKVSSGDLADPTPRMLIRRTEGGGELRAAIYYPDALVQRLEARPPTRGLDEGNIDDFAAFVEELDHLLCVAQRVREGRPFSLLELELHANVTKWLVAVLFLSLLRRAALSRGPAASRPTASRPAPGPTEREKAWLRYHLFDKREFVDEDLQVRSRYRDAARYGWRFLSGLESLTPVCRLEALREFNRQTHHQKLALLN